MDFCTAVLLKSGEYWVALCLENGIAVPASTGSVQVHDPTAALNIENKGGCTHARNGGNSNWHRDGG